MVQWFCRDDDLIPQGVLTYNCILKQSFIIFTTYNSLLTAFISLLETAFRLALKKGAFTTLVLNAFKKFLALKACFTPKICWWYHLIDFAWYVHCPYNTFPRWLVKTLVVHLLSCLPPRVYNYRQVWIALYINSITYSGATWPPSHLQPGTCWPRWPQSL